MAVVITSKGPLTRMIKNYINGNSEGYDEIETWDISNVTNLASLFKIYAPIDSEEKNNAIEGIGEWDVSHVKTMENIFKDCTYFNQSLIWDISNLTDCSRMFENCVNFSLPFQLNNPVNLIKVTGMFDNTPNLHMPSAIRFIDSLPNNLQNELKYYSAPLPSLSQPQPVLPAPHSITFTPQNMMLNPESLAPPDYLQLQINQNNSMTTVRQSEYTKRKPLYKYRKYERYAGKPPVFSDKNELRNAIASYFNGNPNNYPVIGFWNISNIRDMSNLFRTKVNSPPDVSINTPERNELVRGISNWDMSHVTNMSHMFYNCSAFNQHINWEAYSATNMEAMFAYCPSFNKPVIFTFSEIPKVTNMKGMFEGCETFNQKLEWDVSSVENMADMFSGCESLNKYLNWDVKNVTDMSSMFEGCISFNQKLKWKVASLVDARSMFAGCLSFSKPLHSWGKYTDNLKFMSRMFYNCPRFPRYSIQSWECFYYTLPGEKADIDEIFGPNEVKTPLGLPPGIKQYHNVKPPDSLRIVSEGSILDKTIHDPIMLEDITVRDYLRENENLPDPDDTDEKNIIFMQDNLLVGINRSTLKKIILDNGASSVKYPCHGVGTAIYITPDMISNVPFFSNKLIGLFGMTFLSHIKYVIEHPEITAVKLVRSPTTVPAVATASLNVLSALGSVVGAAHCQEGTDENIYELEDISSGTVEPLAGRDTRKRKRHYTKKTNRKKVQTKRRHRVKKQ